MTALKVLAHMCDQAAAIRPWQAKELARECRMPLATLYRNLRSLESYGLVRHVSGGYVLGEKVLGAGPRFNGQLSRLTTPDNFQELQERLYGKGLNATIHK